MKLQPGAFVRGVQSGGVSPHVDSIIHAAHHEYPFTAAGQALAFGPAAPVVAAAPTLASRFQLQGVMAGGPNAGAALIAVDGKAAKPYRVGAALEGGLVLQSVQRRSVRLAPSGNGQAFELSLPEPPATPS